LLAWRISSIANPDPGTSAFLTLDPEKVFPDPGSQTHIFDSLMTDFRVNRTIILSALAKQNFLYQFKNKIIHNFMIFVATEMGRTSATLRVPLPSLVYHSVFIILFFFLFLAS